MERMWRKRAAGGWQELWRHDSRATGNGDGVRRFFAARHRRLRKPAPDASAFLSFRAHLHLGQRGRKSQLAIFRGAA